MVRRRGVADEGSVALELTCSSEWGRECGRSSHLVVLNSSDHERLAVGVGGRGVLQLVSATTPSGPAAISYAEALILDAMAVRDALGCGSN
jgi:hypothetical protein